jgi:ABC-type branched-subunit amino acid transport system substrate-binding protein
MLGHLKFLTLAALFVAFGSVSAAEENACFSKGITAAKPVVDKKVLTPEGAKLAEETAKCLANAGDTASLNMLAARFLEYYSGSPYRAGMEKLVAENLLRTDPAAAISSLLNVLSYGKDKETLESAKNLLVKTISEDSRLKVADLTSIADRAGTNRTVANATWMRLGKELSSQKNFKAARYWYKKVIAAKEDESRVTQATEALSALDGKASVPTVLVLAPLSGTFAEFGQDALKGVKLAFEKSGLSGKVSLRAADTRADAVEALRRAKQVVAQDSVIAIVGPIMSAPSAAVAAWLGSTHPEIPMLTPTATDAGISRMGPNIFQVNVSMDNLAAGIANYSVECLGIREFAILSPIGDFGAAMTQSFKKAAESRGASIVAVQEFEEGHPDYTTEFRKLRAIRFDQLLHKKNIARGAKDLNAINAKEKRSFLQDSVFAIPGIFIPSSSPSDAGLIARQVAFHKLDGTLLGTSGWYGEDLIGEGKKLVEGSYFSVSFADEDSSSSFESFQSAYKSKWNEDPKADKVSGLSYSAADIVFSLLASGETNLVGKIHAQKTFEGVYGKVRFEKGANASVQILSVDSGAFVNRTACPAK